MRPGGKPLGFHLLLLLPRNLFSRLCGRIADMRLPVWLLQSLIRGFAWAFGVDWSEATHPPKHYQTFNEFFTRPLKPGLRPIPPASEALVSPVDGTVGEFGTIREGRLIQAKGLDYTVADLLADPERAAQYEGGEFMTIYLAPHNYHRIHSMVAGEVREFAYNPGDLWTVSPLGVNWVSRLFAINERLTSYLHTSGGECALVKVGAMVVGRIRVRYDDLFSNCPGAVRVQKTLRVPLRVERGEELGRFELGSTVILLFQPEQVNWNSVSVGQPVRLGMALGTFRYDLENVKPAANKSQIKPD
mgnify:FL=1|jgi:phosphatidylserine decarboxylase